MSGNTMYPKYFGLSGRICLHPSRLITPPVLPGLLAADSATNLALSRYLPQDNTVAFFRSQANLGTNKDLLALTGVVRRYSVRFYLVAFHHKPGQWTLPIGSFLEDLDSQNNQVNQRGAASYG